MITLNEFIAHMNSKLPEGIELDEHYDVPKLYAFCVECYQILGLEYMFTNVYLTGSRDLEAEVLQGLEIARAISKTQARQMLLAFIENNPLKGDLRDQTLAGAGQALGRLDEYWGQVQEVLNGMDEAVVLRGLKEINALGLNG